MPIYQLTPLADNIAKMNQVLEARVAAEDRFPLQNGAGWLVCYSGTSTELSNMLGVTGQAQGVAATLSSVLITRIASYYGRGPSDMWEWLKTRFERAS